MSLSESRARAAQAFLMREVDMQSWSKIRDALDFKSVGAAQLAVKRHQQRNPLPKTEAIMAGIVERKRRTLEAALASLTQAQQAKDYSAVARLVDVITRADAELARLFGLSQQTVNINVKQSPSEIIAEAEARLLAVIDAEIVDETREITQ